MRSNKNANIYFSFKTLIAERVQQGMLHFVQR